jgi:hypothetical protein
MRPVNVLRRCGAGGDGNDAGIVTFEFAMLMPTFLLVLALVLTLVTALGAEVKVVDASREAARVAARGDSQAVAVAAGERLAPAGASVRIVDRTAWVEARVSTEVKPLGLFPGFTLHASALALREGP